MSLTFFVMYEENTRSWKEVFGRFQGVFVWVVLESPVHPSVMVPPCYLLLVLGEQEKHSNLVDSLVTMLPPKLRQTSLLQIHNSELEISPRQFF